MSTGRMWTARSRTLRKRARHRLTLAATAWPKDRANTPCRSCAGAGWRPDRTRPDRAVGATVRMVLDRPSLEAELQEQGRGWTGWPRPRNASPPAQGRGQAELSLSKSGRMRASEMRPRHHRQADGSTSARPGTSPPHWNTPDGIAGGDVDRHRRCHGSCAATTCPTFASATR